jgi:hypothetical protein
MNEMAFLTIQGRYGDEKIEKPLMSSAYYPMLRISVETESLTIGYEFDYDTILGKSTYRQIIDARLMRDLPKRHITSMEYKTKGELMENERITHLEKLESGDVLIKGEKSAYVFECSAQEWDRITTVKSPKTFLDLLGIGRNYAKVDKNPPKEPKWEATEETLIVGEDKYIIKKNDKGFGLYVGVRNDVCMADNQDKDKLKELAAEFIKLRQKFE